MQPTESAFDRVKSLLGKMDRSIDEARRRRLEDEDPEAGHADDPHENLTKNEQSGEHASGNGSGESNAVNGSGGNGNGTPPRPASKYGRATPIRDTSSSNPAQWRQT